MLVDLHCHSNFSDGILSPAELLSRASEADIELFALTDHDTIDGLQSLHAANTERKINIINGIEISACWRKYDLHILGYNFDFENSELISLIHQQKQNRIQRAQQISENLAKYGVEEAFAKANKYASNDNVGRPHFAKVLIDEGIVSDMQQAFNTYLAAGKKAYVKSSWTELVNAVRIIKLAGGCAVIAHPLKYKLTYTKLTELICDFKEAGGEGIEVISADAQDAQVKLLTDLCIKFDMRASCGSDFHSDKVSRVNIGRQRILPNECVPIWHKWSLN